MRAKSLMVMGTASDVGKSTIVTGLCRMLAQAGVRVAPFKSQNMSNNAAVCPGGGEIGRAQAVQAEACGLEPSVEMNPVLLKPEGEAVCQVVIGGRPCFRISVHEHDRYRAEAWPEIVSSYQSLASRFDVLVIEGAGGAAEVNLRDRDIANWAVAEMADAPVFLVADIDKGGALAALIGTVELLSIKERQRVKGFIINKFRGDLALLDDGLRIVEQRTGIPVLGAVPYGADLQIPQEDSASLKMRTDAQSPPAIRVGVVCLPRISNYTDFDPFATDPNATVDYLDRPDRAAAFDVLCLPGSKSTVADLTWLREVGWEQCIRRRHREGAWVVGICGGYQMLGSCIRDPEHVESPVAEVPGLGMLDVETEFGPDKVTARVKAIHTSCGLPVCGYEIHSGRIGLVNSRNAPFEIVEREGRTVREPEGAVSDDCRVLGTSIHGLFDSPAFRRHFLNEVRARKGQPALEGALGEDMNAIRSRTYDRLAAMLRTHLELSMIAAAVGLKSLSRSSG